MGRSTGRGRTPGLIPGPSRVAYKGRLHIAYNRKYETHVARSWPRGNGGMTPAREAAVRQFRLMVEAARNVVGQQKQAALEAAEKTTFTWRDLIQQAATGRMLWWYDQNGKLWMGWRMANETIQVLLDSIYNVPGSLLVRGPSGWLALLTPTTRKVLTYDPDVAFPQWEDTEIDPQAVLDGITSDIGAMLVRTSTGWAAVEPGLAGQVLTSTGAGAPVWAAGGGGASSPRSTPDFRPDSTDNWAAYYIILRRIILRAGDVVSGGCLPVRLNESGTHWSVGIYDGTLDGPVNLLGASSTQTGLLGQNINAATFTAPVTIAADGCYWIGAWSDAGSFIFKETGQLQAFWSQPSGVWPSIAPSFATNTNGAVTMALVN